MQGSCLCGDVTFEIGGLIPKLYQCHCSLCRKQGGSSSNSAMLISAEHFQWITGQEQISCYEKPTGFRSHFCSRCGSPVPNPLRSTAYYWVPAGLLDGDQKFEIGMHLFIGSKAAWDEVPTEHQQFDTMPELSALIALMHSES